MTASPKVVDGLVITTKSVTGSPAFVARPTHPSTPVDNRLWLDVNILGTHMAQVYSQREVEPVTPELIDLHLLCRDCMGYGLVKEPAMLVDCPTCGGTGSSRYPSLATG